MLCPLEYLHATNPIINANIHVGTEVGLIIFFLIFILLRQVLVAACGV